MPITPEQLASSGSESDHQSALFCWCALAAVSYPDLRWFFAIPNGGARDQRTGARLKATGVKRGVLDTCLPVKRGSYSGLWIELKIEKYRTHKNGGLTDEQVLWKDHLLSQGYTVGIAYSWMEARDMLIWYLNYGK